MTHCCIAKENSLFVIEDAAQSFGAKYKDKISCSFGDIAARPFFGQTLAVMVEVCVFQ